MPRGHSPVGKDGWMTRTDDDTWDITESVGATALAVAAARAAETESAQPLFRDPYARVFLDAAGTGTWSVFDRLPDAELDQELRTQLTGLRDFFASRTAFIDDFFDAATDAGIRQVVILAAGLDARAWRLRWPEGTRLYELDQPKVLDFKSSTLRAHGAVPTAERFEVAVDLRRDWPKVLCERGFDAGQPTAWSVEGLLRYLTSVAQDLLFERIHALSAVGSRLVANAPTEAATDPQRAAHERELSSRMRSALGHRDAVHVPDPEELAYAEKRTDPVEWLSEHGWDASATTVSEAVARYRRRAADETSPVPSSYLSARRSG
jgi:methyltransferase (TIGR00027 family)